MRPLFFTPLVVALSVCAPLAFGAGSQATLTGGFALSGSPMDYDVEDIPVTHSVGRLTFDGKGGITSASIRQGAGGEVVSFTARGNYTLAANCQGTGTMTLSSDGVPVSNVSLQFVVSGTPSQPQISMLISAPNDGITTLARLSKISI
ncbi:MAG: hypothetical protein ACKO4A_07170 [Gammaproteobacteria bacterium]